MACLIDTDILTHIRQGKHLVVAQRASSYLAQYGHFTFSLMTRFEVLRGLKAKNATVQLASFEGWCYFNTILSISDEVIVLAADLYAHLRQTGRLIGDNDLIIAATALHHGLSLATANIAHFSRIPGLTLEDWTKP